MSVLLDAILSIVIIIGLVLLGYIAITKKTFSELWEELKEIFSPTEVVDIR